VNGNKSHFHCNKWFHWLFGWRVEVWIHKSNPTQLLSNFISWTINSFKLCSLVFSSLSFSSCIFLSNVICRTKTRILETLNVYQLKQLKYFLGLQYVSFQLHWIWFNFHWCFNFIPNKYSLLLFEIKIKSTITECYKSKQGRYNSKIWWVYSKSTKKINQSGILCTRSKKPWSVLDKCTFIHGYSFHFTA
jgi:hypothetical protein